MKFNINEEVKCVLTDKGEKILETKNPISYKYNYSQVRHELTEQLWVIMNIFGGELFNGGNQLILNNIIEL